MSHKVFVYGTLKRGQANNKRLKDSKFLGEAETTHSYRMYTNRSYPMIIEDQDHGKAIKGELYEVSDEVLKDLDYLEGQGFLYERKKLHIKGHDDVIGYVYLKSIANLDEVLATDGVVSWPEKPKELVTA